MMNGDDCTRTVPRVSGLGIGDARLPYTLRDIFHALILTVLVWHERRRQRRHLAQLNDHMLRDIGLSRGDVWAECEKPFWRS